METLNNNMAKVPTLVFPNWKKEFHMHVNALFVALSVVLAHPSEGSIDHPIAFSSRKVSTIEKNYTMTKR